MTIRADATEIVHVREYADPDACLFGMSPLEGIMYDVFGDSEAARYNYAFFKNDAVPSALYVLESGLEESEQKIIFEGIKRELEGGINKHKALISAGVTDVKVLAKSHTDAAFQEQRTQKVDTVCAAMGVPKIVLGYTDGVNYTNADVQYSKFIENTVRPMEELLEETLETLFNEINPKVDVEIIDDHINDIDKKVVTARSAVEAGIINRNEAREIIGYEPIDNPDMEEITVQAGVTFLDDLNAESIPEDMPEDQNPDLIPT